MPRRLLLLLSCAVLVAALPARAQAAPGAAGRLHAAQADYRRHLLASRPDLASALGWGGAAALLPITQAAIERDEQWLGEFAATLAAIPPAELAPRERVALDSLSARVEREREPLRSGAWANDPRLYLAAGPLAALESAAAPGVTPCERARRAAKRLAALPELLRAAEVNLRAARGFDRERTLLAWGAARDSLRWALPAHVAGCREGERDADLIEADTTALGAVDHFVRFLREDLAAAPADSGAGAPR